MATLTVKGRAVVPAEPDEATIVLELSSLEQTADLAYRDVAERNAQLRAVCDELGIPAASRSTEGIWVGPHLEYVDGREEHRGYRALNRIAVRLEAADLVARLVQEAVTRADARIQATIDVEAGERLVRAAVDVTFVLEQG